jgi:crossover junction endodeoxyribonuclease RuvC
MRTAPRRARPPWQFLSSARERRASNELVSRRIRILGIDPGSQTTGFGIVDLEGGKVSGVHWGCIKTAGDHSARLRLIFAGLADVVRELEPAEIAIESIFVHRNADSALKLGQARAAALCATFQSDLPVFEYSPKHIKKAVVGTGRAEKTQVQHMVKLMLGVRGPLQADAADALAAALCHAYSRGPRRAMLDAASSTAGAR